MLRIEGGAALPDREHQVQQLAHGMADRDGLLVGMLGNDALVQGPHRRVEANGRQAGHPEIAPYQVIAPWAHDVAARPAGLAVAIDAAADLEGQSAEVGDELVRRLEAVDVEDEGGEDGGRDVTDARDAIDLI